MLRDGHAPGHVREMFADVVDVYTEWKVGQPEPTVEFDDDELSLSKAARRLYNCTDVLPARAVTQLRDAGLDFKRHTYGAAARSILASVKVHDDTIANTRLYRSPELSGRRRPKRPKPKWLGDTIAAHYMMKRRFAWL